MRYAGLKNFEKNSIHEYNLEVCIESGLNRQSKHTVFQTVTD